MHAVHNFYTKQIPEKATYTWLPAKLHHVMDIINHSYLHWRV